MGPSKERKRFLRRARIEAFWNVLEVAFPCIVFAALIVFILYITGCSKRVVYFPAIGVPVQTLESVDNVKVAVRQASTGEMIEATATIPVGAWILFDPGEFTVEERASRMNLERR